ncbi:MAG: branched-chain amino acid ABC transporter permease [Candidatus Methanomethylicia archaeon]
MQSSLMEIVKNRRNQVILVFFIMLTLYPLLLVDRPYFIWVAIMCNFFAVLVINWDILLGYGNLLSFAHTGLLAVGAYSSVMLVNWAQLPPLIGMFFGSANAAAMGFILGWICLRLKGIYLALATWGFSGIVQRILIAEYYITGGLKGFPTSFLLPVSSFTSPIYYYYVSLLILIICILSTFKLINSRYGLLLTAMGNDEIALASLGVNVTWLKISLFTISSFWIGLAGAFYSHLLGYVSPAIADFATMMVTVMAATIVGGLGTFFGPIIGTFIIYPLIEVIRVFGGANQQLILVIVILIFLKFLRNGLWGLVRILIAKQSV